MKRRFVKKPVIIEAIKWTGSNLEELEDFFEVDPYKYHKTKGEYYIDHSRIEGGLVIKTLEGEHVASIGDYIIKGVAGEYYPCKPNIFFKTYDLIVEPKD